AEAQQRAITNWRAAYADGRRVVAFLVEHLGDVAGSVDVKQWDGGRGELSWAVFPRHRGQRVATRALRLLIDYCFRDLRLDRVEAKVEPANVASLRTARRAGLRREGLARCYQDVGGQRADFIWLARLATDPPPTTRAGFNGVLDAELPRKHVIVQGVARDHGGRVLLCQLVYKPEWDLPGGIIDPGESPAGALAREIREELGLELPVGGLLAVNWLPPWKGWSDACQIVFDLGGYDESLTEQMILQAREITAVHWCAPGAAARHVAPYLATFLPVVLAAADTGVPVYLEAGAPNR
ncbi:MAG: NUDIX hydrolase, partial [Sciscionella sp.]